MTEPAWKIRTYWERNADRDGVTYTTCLINSENPGEISYGKASTEGMAIAIAVKNAAKRYPSMYREVPDEP